MLRWLKCDGTEIDSVFYCHSECVQSYSKQMWIREKILEHHSCPVKLVVKLDKQYSLFEIMTQHSSSWLPRLYGTQQSDHKIVIVRKDRDHKFFSSSTKTNSTHVIVSLCQPKSSGVGGQMRSYEVKTVILPFSMISGTCLSCSSSWRFSIFLWMLSLEIGNVSSYLCYNSIILCSKSCSD